jgi:hypothetical protein
MSGTGFLDDTDLKRLTGCGQKSRQIRWLRDAGIPFRVNATGHPVVTWAAVEGRQAAAEPSAPARGWTPRVIGG